MTWDLHLTEVRHRCGTKSHTWDHKAFAADEACLDVKTFGRFRDDGRYALVEKVDEGE